MPVPIPSSGIDGGARFASDWVHGHILLRFIRTKTSEEQDISLFPDNESSITRAYNALTTALAVQEFPSNSLFVFQIRSVNILVNTSTNTGVTLEDPTNSALHASSMIGTHHVMPSILLKFWLTHQPNGIHVAASAYPACAFSAFSAHSRSSDAKMLKTTSGPTDTRTSRRNDKTD